MSVFPQAASVVEQFVAANKEFRRSYGNPVTFSIPVAPEWPSGTLINPDTQLPYDAMVQPSGPSSTRVTITALVVLKEASPLRPQSEVRYEAAGSFESMDVILDVDSDDYPTIGDATEFTVNERNYRIEEAKPFATAGVLYRFLIYGAER